MTAPGHSVPVALLRETAARAVADMSLRKVAAEVGVSPMGLSHFLNGGQPYDRTVRKLLEWYLRHVAHERINAETAAIALALVLDGIPDARFLATRAKLRDHIREAYKRSGVQPPAWLDKIVP